MATAQADQPAGLRPRISISMLVALATSLLAIAVVLSAIPVLLVQYYL